MRKITIIFLFNLALISCYDNSKQNPSYKNDSQNFNRQSIYNPILNNSEYQSTSYNQPVDNYSIKNYEYESQRIMDDLNKKLEEINSRNPELTINNIQEKYPTNSSSNLSKIDLEKIEREIKWREEEFNRSLNFKPYEPQYIPDPITYPNNTYNNSGYNSNDYVNPNANPNTVEVKGYIKSNGTYVEPHIRTAPNSTLEDNLRY